MVNSKCSMPVLVMFNSSMFYLITVLEKKNFFNMKKDFIIFRCFVKEHVIFTPTTPDGIHV